ncbi:hypothetical protein Vadar_032338 [Vaccinium darrowii]|uniref:Uncharacterized protein n=1 Tax=Vaccinium darrowii TaxID=229202 RepID=A0ACB7XDR4_9ERIC|nr:hypothetical protein Vadar_032338 [Vaccinium darrowii]
MTQSQQFMIYQSQQWSYNRMWPPHQTSIETMNFPNPNPNPNLMKQHQGFVSLKPCNWKGKKANNDKRRKEKPVIISDSGSGVVSGGGGRFKRPTLNELQHQNRIRARKFYPKKKYSGSGTKNIFAPYAPRNTFSFIIRAKKLGGIASIISRCLVTPVKGRVDDGVNNEFVENVSDNESEGNNDEAVEENNDEGGELDAKEEQHDNEGQEHNECARDVCMEESADAKQEVIDVDTSKDESVWRMLSTLIETGEMDNQQGHIVIDLCNGLWLLVDLLCRWVEQPTWSEILYTVEDRDFSSWSFVRYLDELDVGPTTVPVRSF